MGDQGPRPVTLRHSFAAAAIAIAVALMATPAAAPAAGDDGGAGSAALPATAEMYCDE